MDTSEHTTPGIRKNGRSSDAEESTLPIYASIAANFAIATTKFIAAGATGSSAMVAEGVHSLVDCADGSLLLFGRNRSKRPADEEHPFGHGQDLYFWTLIVAVLFFAVGGGVSVFEGIKHIIDPEPIRDPKWNYIVLGVAALFDGGSFVIAFREFRKVSKGRSLWSAIRGGSDPSLITIVLEDSADITGLFVAFVAVYLGHRYDNPYFDGVGSIVIGFVLSTVAVLLMAQSHRLLIGEGANLEQVSAIRKAASADESIKRVRRVLTLNLGPGKLLVTLGVRFAEHQDRAQVAQAIERLEQRVRDVAPEARHIYLEAESLRGGGDFS